MDAHSPQHPRPSGVTLTLQPAVVARRLALFVLVIAAVGAMANLYIYQIAPDPEHRLAKLMQRLDLGHEPSIPALYSSLALLASAVLLGVIAIAVKRSGAPFFAHWFGLAIVFVLLAIDESIMIHEMVDTVLHESLETRGIFFFAWVIPGLMFAALIGIVYLRFLWHLDGRTRVRFIGAGALFLFGAVGMEMVAGLIADSSLGLESIAHTVSQTIEETCEMLGVVVFIHALLDYIDRNVGVIRISTSEAKAEVKCENSSSWTPNHEQVGEPALSGEQP